MVEGVGNITCQPRLGWLPYLFFWSCAVQGRGCVWEILAPGHFPQYALRSKAEIHLGPGIYLVSTCRCGGALALEALGSGTCLGRRKSLYLVFLKFQGIWACFFDMQKHSIWYQTAFYLKDSCLCSEFSKPILKIQKPRMAFFGLSLEMTASWGIGYLVVFFQRGCGVAEGLGVKRNW